MVADLAEQFTPAPARLYRTVLVVPRDVLRIHGRERPVWWIRAALDDMRRRCSLCRMSPCFKHADPDIQMDGGPTWEGGRLRLERCAWKREGCDPAWVAGVLRSSEGPQGICWPCATVFGVTEVGPAWHEYEKTNSDRY